VGVAVSRTMKIFNVVRWGENLVVPEDYLHAAGEVVFLMFALSWSITYLYDYRRIMDNPLKDMFGYDNLFAALDEHPAIYVTTWLSYLGVYCVIRYAVLALERASLSNLTAKQMFLQRIATVFYFLSFSSLPLVFVVTKDVSPRLHIAFFLQAMVSRWFVTAANHLTADAGTVGWKSFGLLILFGIIVLGNVICAGLNIAMYKTGGSPVISPYISFPLELFWWLCLPLSSHYMPNMKAMHVELNLEELKQAMDDL